ncbi:MAG: ABC-F family ATP-binding cassette domain-containing protein [Bacteroidales bacterium]|nr:ABC-F family ATP-binding cassette domain-containing protein [Bacteroidales bacterium]
MISYLQVEHISKSFGDLTLFEDLSFGIAKDQKTALIAKNGKGKTTLLNILAGKDTPDSGEVIYRNEVKVGYLSQEPVMDPESTTRDYIFHSSDEIMKAVRRYEEALISNDDRELGESIEQMDRLKAWDYEVKVKQILTQLNVGVFHRKIGSLSGGEKKRLALAEVLIQQPGFLILDEPTNHLDLNMIEWLEDHLKNHAFTLLMVTHDRYFLDRVCNDILEIDEQDLYRYKGNYSYFLKKRAERIHNQEREIEKAKNQLRKEEDWIKRMPKARGTKAKYRVDNYYHLKDVASQQKEDETMKVDFESSRLGKKIMIVRHLTKAYDDTPLIKDFSYQFNRNEKVGLIGPNGSGKTTFLNLLAGTDQPDQGSIEAGETLRIGYYRQEGMHFDEDQRVIDVARNVAEAVTMSDGKTLTAKQFLDYFLFDYDKQYVRVAKLSGGEKRRLYLLTVLLKKPNFLILDEPTNDLDIMTLNVLEDYLSHFKGCVVIVSHDRYFMDNIVDHVFAFQGQGQLKDFPGTYTQYRRQIMEGFTSSNNQLATPHKNSGNKSQKPKKKAVSYKLKKEYQQLTREIEHLEEEKQEIENQISQGGLSNDEVVKQSNRLGELTKQIDEKTLRWFELSEIME